MTARIFDPARPVEVWCVPRGDRPCRLRWRGRTAWIAAIEASWRWDEGWWRTGDRTHPAGGYPAGGGEGARRAYFRLATRDGLRCVVYRDLDAGRWYLESILD